MKNLTIAMILGATASKNLNDVSDDIWNESTESYSVCQDPWNRWDDQSNSMSTFQSALKGGSVYQDYDFRANMNSIYSTDASPSQYDIRSYKNNVIGWKRPKDIYPGEQVHLKGTQGMFAPSGIRQGGLGDCWFLAGVCALAENPERLNQVVHKDSRQNYPQSGIFRYFFWVEKKWVPINIDDRLPIGYKYSNSKDYFSTWATGRSNYGAWWMPLLEKAFSKLNGNYDRIVGGSGYESLRLLTNKPVFQYNHPEIQHKQPQMFKLFHKMARENYPMVTGCCSAARNAPDGLINGHAYTLLDVIEIQGTQLAKMRNPWSKEGYNGPWSDSDSRWTPALLKQVGHTKANDGVFFIPFANFLRKPYFDRTAVAIYKNFGNTQIFQINQRAQKLKITITIPSRQVVYFTLETLSSRFKRQCSSDQNQVNTYFYPGTRYTGQNCLIYELGFLGNGFFHTTVGKPDYALNAGTYTLQVMNWGIGSVNPMKYSLTMYQEGTDKITVSY